MTPTTTTPQSMDEATRLTISPSVYARAFGEELVLLDFAKGEYFGLDAIGAEIWRELESGQALGAIADSLVQRYEVPRQELFRDIIDLVTHMRDNGLVEIVSANAKTD